MIGYKVVGVASEISGSGLGAIPGIFFSLRMRRKGLFFVVAPIMGRPSVTLGGVPPLVIENLDSSLTLRMTES